MDATLSELPSFLEEFTLSQLPFFSEDRVDGCTLPPRPLSACQDCWNGPFAGHFGIPLVSPWDGQWYRHWPRRIMYSSTKAKLQSRADTGCSWCRFILFWGSKRRELLQLSEWNITIQGFLKTWHPRKGDMGPSPQYHEVNVKIGKFGVFTGHVHTADDPAAPFIHSRSPVWDVGSPRALALARMYIDECIHVHEVCKTLAPRHPRLPSRLIECIDPARPRLVSTGGDHGEYLALSYVWGGDQVHKTTKRNISTYEQGVSTSLLPATIRDAISVTHTMGFQWLWVDSLCIVQDSDEDKRHEIGRMPQSYPKP
ncbi:hypothetical protein VTO73DRAFT_7774 [Trametes versicolor]